LVFLAAVLAPDGERPPDGIQAQAAGWRIADFAASEAAQAIATPCSQVTTEPDAAIVFERISLADDPHSPPVQPASREIVAFDWNPRTSELTYRTTAATRIFNDLERDVSVSATNYLRCE
jgi:hypothetical protein